MVGKEATGIIYHNGKRVAEIKQMEFHRFSGTDGTRGIANGESLEPKDTGLNGVIRKGEFIENWQDVYNYGKDSNYQPNLDELFYDDTIEIETIDGEKIKARHLIIMNLIVKDNMPLIENTKFICFLIEE